MSALTAPRPPREVFCGGNVYSRKRKIADGCTIYPGAIVALDPDGNAVPAADSPDLIVVGICNAVFAGDAYIWSGVFKMDISGEMRVRNIGNYVYIADDHTVTRDRGENGIVAGWLMDIDNGLAVVSIGNYPIKFN